MKYILGAALLFTIIIFTLIAHAQTLTSTQLANDRLSSCQSDYFNTNNEMNELSGRIQQLQEQLNNDQNCINNTNDFIPVAKNEDALQAIQASPGNSLIVQGTMAPLSFEYDSLPIHERPVRQENGEIIYEGHISA